MLSIEVVQHLCVKHGHQALIELVRKAASEKSNLSQVVQIVSLKPMQELFGRILCDFSTIKIGV